MTISHEGSTGSPAASAQGSTSISVAYPAGVAAGRIAVLVASVKLSGATFGTVTDFTPIGTQAGGTGTSANDAGTTRVGAWYKVLTGSESGSVTVTNDTGVSSAGAMSIYSGTAGGWAAPAFVAGADTGHGANWSAACGAWAATLAANDLLVVANSTDTDAAQTITSPTITQTGATFGTVTQRNASRSSTGTDSGAYSWDAPVTGGSANAPTWTHTSATSACGATIIVRLREVTVVSGTAAGSFTFTSTAAGQKDVSGTTVAAFTFAGTAVGQKDVTGATTAAFTFTGTANGEPGQAPPAEGQAVGAFTFTATAVGQKDVTGQAAAAVTWTATAAGEVGVFGTTELALAFTGTASGERGVEAQSVSTVTFTATGVGERGVEGPALGSLSFTATASGGAAPAGADVTGVVLGAFTFTGEAVVSVAPGPPIGSQTVPRPIASSSQPAIYSSGTAGSIYASSNGG